MNRSNIPTNLSEQQLAQMERVAALRHKPKKKADRLVISGQVADELVPYAKNALTKISKTDLINLALACFFEVQVYEAAN